MCRASRNLFQAIRPVENSKAMCWSSLAYVCFETPPKLVEPGPNSAELGPTVFEPPNLSPKRHPKLVEHIPDLAERALNLVEPSPRPKLGRAPAQIWPQRPHSLVEIVTNWQDPFQSRRAKIRTTPCNIHPVEFAPMWSNLGILFGRSRAIFG